MLHSIVSFLLDVIGGLLGGACLLRLYMQHQHVPFRNPVGQLVFALTDWLVLPLRRVLPAVGRWDTASLVGAYLLELVQIALLWALFGRAMDPLGLPLWALLGLVRMAIAGLTGLVIFYALLSWVRAESHMTDIIDRLCAPLLQPFRRVLPLVGGFDLSPLALLVLLQVAGMLLNGLQAQWFY